VRAPRWGPRWRVRDRAWTGRAVRYPARVHAAAAVLRFRGRHQERDAHFEDASGSSRGKFVRGKSDVAEAGKIDPMHQFTVEPLAPLQLAGYDLSFPNRALWLMIALALVAGFIMMGMKRQLVPGRWQMAVEG